MERRLVQAFAHTVSDTPIYLVSDKAFAEMSYSIKFILAPDPINEPAGPVQRSFMDIFF